MKPPRKEPRFVVYLNCGNCGALCKTSGTKDQTRFGYDCKACGRGAIEGYYIGDFPQAPKDCKIQEEEDGQDVKVVRALPVVQE